MGLVGEVTKEVRQNFASQKLLRDEDSLRVLARNERKGYRLPVIYADDDFLLTKDSAWCGYAVPNKPWGFLNESARRNNFWSAEGFFDRIFPADKENAGQILVTNRVYSADEWEDSLLSRYEDTATPAFRDYVRYSRKAIERNEFFERECYMFVRMGARGNRGGVRNYVRTMLEQWAMSQDMDDSQPDEDEVDYWRKQSASTMDSIGNSYVQGLPIHRRRLEWVTRHLDTPGLPTPDTSPADKQYWGAGEWRTVLSSGTKEIDLGVAGKNRYRCVQFDAPTGAGVTYAAYLPLAVVPNAAHYEQNWIHHASSLDFPVDASFRYEVVDPDRAEREHYDRAVQAAEAQAEEDSEAGVRTDEMTQMQNESLRQIKMRTQHGRDPMAFWQCVFAVYDTNKDALLTKVTRLIKHYKDIHFELVCPRNDQRELFYQSFPGSEILVQDWMHRSDTGWLASAMPWLTSTVGDRDEGHGLYQGPTIVRDANGQKRSGTPVFFDLQNVVDDEGKAPTEAVAGEPGSGKSVSRGLKVAQEDCLRGVTQFVWDPKGDFLPLKRYAKKLKLDPEKVKLVDLHNAGDSVSLDAFALAEVSDEDKIDERETSALDMLQSLCYQYTDQVHQDVLGEAVTAVMQRERIEGVDPTMGGVLEMLRDFSRGDLRGMTLGNPDRQISEETRDRVADHAARLVTHLERVKGSVLGRLLFLDPKQGTMSVEQGDLVIFVAIKMTPTEPNEKPTLKSAISDVVSGLMTDYIRSMLHRLPDHVAKTMVFDEWHVIKRSSRAPALLDWMRRMGRSKRCSVRQLSQSAGDFDKGSLSAVWCGYVEGEAEAELSCDLLGIEKSADNMQRLMNLRAGQFLFRDALKRVAEVQVDIWDDWVLEKFNTSPAAKERLYRQLVQSGELARVSVTADDVVEIEPESDQQNRVAEQGE